MISKFWMLACTCFEECILKKGKKEEEKKQVTRA
jgi:hypothetical protein